MQEKIDEKWGSLKDKKGESIICNALALCLKSAQWQEQMIKENGNLRTENVELSLQYQMTN